MGAAPPWPNLAGLPFFKRATIVFPVGSGGILLRLLLNWVLSAVALWIVAHVISGFHVSGPVAALIAALVIGFVNATLGAFLKIITFPLTLITLGIFWLVINAAMIELASAIVRGFRVDTFGAAFWGAIVLSLVNMALRALAGTDRARA
jgi:putative membrane protein